MNTFLPPYQYTSHLKTCQCLNCFGYNQCSANILNGTTKITTNILNIQGITQDHMCATSNICSSA